VENPVHPVHPCLNAAQEQHYREQGYVILRGIIPAAEVEALRAAVRELVEASAVGKGPEIPWINREKRVPERLGQLLRPGWTRPAFVNSLERGPYFAIADQILGTAVRYSLFGMLAGGDGKAYVQNWHRDLAPVSGEHELAVLERNYGIYTQINAPLFPDRYLTIVPGSHLRRITAAERAALAENPTGDMPGQLTVETEPGDVAFYYSNLLHRGYNPEGAMRWTMHHAFVRADSPVAVHERGQEAWITSPGYIEALPPDLRMRMQRYLDAVPDGPSPNIAVA
jgi:ectoine hydroxylase-related dioxygenase (phytanoyl-CoA dioxygenase family)